MKKILLVEDSESIRKEIVDALVSVAPCELTEADDGMKGYTLLSARPAYFDLVLLDYRMPGMTGIDILRKLRDGGKALTCPVVMITTVIETKGSEAKDLNIVAWVIKPIRKPRLQQLVIQIFEDLDSP